jgi:transposase
MEHVAIDLGGSQSQVCVRTPDGAVVQERRCRTSDLVMYMAQRPPSRVILETCAEAFHFCDAMRSQGHEVRVVAATLVRTLGVGARGIKSDRRDAQVLSEVSTRIDLRGVHVPSHLSRQRKAQSTTREALVTARTQLINATRGLLRTQAIRPRTGATESFPRRVREALGQQVPEHLQWLLASIETLNAQLVCADKALRQVAESDPACRQLMTVPGVGPLTSIRFLAAVDRVDRFSDAHALQAYLGLVPGEDSSGERQRRTSITKAGSGSVRRVLVQAALTAKRQCRNEPMVQWALEVEKRRGKHIATVALARKMAGILFAMLRDGAIYRSQSSASPLAPNLPM